MATTNNGRLYYQREGGILSWSDDMGDSWEDGLNTVFVHIEVDERSGCLLGTRQASRRYLHLNGVYLTCDPTPEVMSIWNPSVSDFDNVVPIKPAGVQISDSGDVLFVHNREVSANHGLYAVAIPRMDTCREGKPDRLRLTVEYDESP